MNNRSPDKWEEYLGFLGVYLLECTYACEIAEQGAQHGNRQNEPSEHNALVSTSIPINVLLNILKYF